MSVTYTATLTVREQTVLFVSSLLHAERLRRGTRTGTRALDCFAQAVLVLRWFLDGTRLAQLATDNAISKSTAHNYLHEGINALAARAPKLESALLAAKMAGHPHVNIDGTLIETDRCATPGPTPGVDLWWSGKHDNHGGNIQVLTAPTAGHCGLPRYAPAVNTTPQRCGNTPRSWPCSPRKPQTIYACWVTLATKAKPTPSPSRSRNPGTANCQTRKRPTTRSTTASAPSASAATPC